jgi:hypothetical protein
MAMARAWVLQSTQDKKTEIKKKKSSIFFLWQASFSSSFNKTKKD